MGIAHKKGLATCSAIVIVIIVLAYVISVEWKSAPVKPGTDLVGICVHSLSANDAQLISDTGAGWVRVDVQRDFGEMINNARAHNLKVLGILDSWMFNQSIDFSLEEWRGNVTFYVSQFTDYVDGWEIWSEPSHPNFTIPIDKYYLMVQIASSIIRQYDPSAKIVLFGGLKLWSGDDPTLTNDKEYAQQLANMDIEQFGDAISVHAYPWGPVKELIWGKFDESLAFYRGLFNDSLEMWVTEVGQKLEDGGESGQAQYASDALEHFRGKVTRIFWYSLLDNANDPGRFGLIGEGISRPAYYTLKHQISITP